MEMAKRARKAETPKQPSRCLRLRAPYLYPDSWRSIRTRALTPPRVGTRGQPSMLSWSMSALQDRHDHRVGEVLEMLKTLVAAFTWLALAVDTTTPAGPFRHNRHCLRVSISAICVWSRSSAPLGGGENW